MHFWKSHFKVENESGTEQKEKKRPYKTGFKAQSFEYFWVWWSFEYVRGAKAADLQKAVKNLANTPTINICYFSSYTAFESSLNCGAELWIFIIAFSEDHLVDSGAWAYVYMEGSKLAYVVPFQLNTFCGAY